jgi:hypothetical protein
MRNLEERVAARLNAQGRSPLSNTTASAEGHPPRPGTPISTLPVQDRTRPNGGKTVVAVVLLGVFATMVCGWLATIEARLLKLEATLATTTDQVASLLAAPSSKPLPIVLVAPPPLPPTPASEPLLLSLSLQSLSLPKAHGPKKP